MKKRRALPHVIVLLALCFLASPVLAEEVLHCIDTENTGFHWEGGHASKTNFELSRFFVKIGPAEGAIRLLSENTALLRKHRKGSCNTSRLSTGAKKSRVWVALYATTRQPTGCRGYLEAMATTSERIYWEDPLAPSIQRLFPSIQIFLLHMASAPSFEHSNLANNLSASSCDSRRPYSQRHRGAPPGPREGWHGKSGVPWHLQRQLNKANPVPLQPLMQVSVVLRTLRAAANVTNPVGSLHIDCASQTA